MMTLDRTIRALPSWIEHKAEQLPFVQVVVIDHPFNEKNEKDTNEKDKVCQYQERYIVLNEGSQWFLFVVSSLDAFHAIVTNREPRQDR